MYEQPSDRFDVIVTERLVLRGLQMSDGSQMAAIRSDSEVNRYINRSSCLSLAEAEAFIRKIQGSVAGGESYYWAICFKDEGKLLGTICLWNVEADIGQVELGYELLPAFQRKGIMTEAMERIISLAFGQLNFKRIIAITNTENARSIALLERFDFLISRDYTPELELSEGEACFSLDHQ
jgi:ribosomal-protein-alanine N-acetyltransferase